MHTGDVVHLFEGKRGNRKRGNRSQTTKRSASRSALSGAWARVTSFAAAVAEVARESRELERRLLNRRGYRQSVDR